MSITNSGIRLTTSISRIRPPAVAGTFYPAGAEELRRVVTRMLEAEKVESSAPKAIITPHAGYIYSGSTAAKAYASLSELKHSVTRVILLGPAHRVYVKGLALSSATAFATPLGNLKIDLEAAAKIQYLPQVTLFDKAHAQEHSLEVQLPFLQQCLDRFLLLPIVVGEATTKEVTEVLDILWGGDETLIVISSDLSHYHEYDESQKIDTATSRLIENNQFEKLEPQRACGCRPMQGLLNIARRREMKIKRLGLCNSGDTAGSRDRVVGYGAWSLHEKQMLDEKQKRVLLQVAKKSIEQGFDTHRPLNVDLKDYSSALCETKASFVTLKINNQLRGCIGTTLAIHPLVMSIADVSFKAAFEDPRFKPLTPEEYKNIALSISVLTPELAIPFATEEELVGSLQPGKDGLTIMTGARKATFLPLVWDSIPSANNFLKQLKLKAGLKADEQVELAWRYAAINFS
jgi:AmmeMemoRadiSam system protein B/AmmeMemoRadiSam system protein A